MNTPPIVSMQEWKAAHEQLLVKEKALTRARDALAAEQAERSAPCGVQNGLDHDHDGEIDEEAPQFDST